MFRSVSRSLMANAAMARTGALRSAPAMVRFNITQHSSMLTKEDVLARSVQVLRGFNVKTPEIGLETKFSQDLGMDSLDYNDALVALEEEFDIIFDDEAANKIQSVGECVNYVIANYIPEEIGLDAEIR
ncbi:unnamed protein product [Kuraishia capsulata CBS 1993]|uniref:Acyl carrier protein n=1 Tax=Kuraishia capsulata CBS 1993 TaxID=1382522 RepID=W6MXG9_9ASCO|nr:uncharacterized protein KUCA_T00004855001 [Kuraishia capsulata CBS 1993]CDK28870.1 unnamed protein product [Kuraishia capsulata CBS 1993]